MSRFFPHPQYAEDQPLSHAILTTHVLTRGLTTGAIIGAAFTTSRQLIPAFRQPGNTAFMSRLLLSASANSIITMGIVTVGMLARTGFSDKIQWQDRSWRLLASKGQVEVDDWTYAGAAAATAAYLVKGPKALGWRGALGAAGLGSVVGTSGYMAWRYGVKGGKFPEDSEIAA